MSDPADYRALVFFVLLVMPVIAICSLLIGKAIVRRALRRQAEDFPKVTVVAARKITGKGKIEGPAIVITTDKNP